MSTEGPVTFTQMGVAARAREVHEWTLFATEETDQWKVMGDNPELYAQLIRDPSEHVGTLKRMRTGSSSGSGGTAAHPKLTHASSDPAFERSDVKSAVLLRKALSSASMKS